jgi:dTDP-glucose pyrophosphorylase
MSEINKLFISKNTKIKDCLKILDEAVKYHIALVVDEFGRLEGAVTDGDVRRGLLKKVNLNDPVSKIMNSKPITLKDSTDKDKIAKFLKEKSLRQIILTDENSRVSNVVTVDCLFTKSAKPNKVFLMAGGLGSRLRPLTNDIPKPMLQVGGSPILQTIIEKFIDEGFQDFYLSVNYKKEIIQEHFQDGSEFECNIKYIEENKRMGTAGALSLLDEIPDEPMVVMNGDLLTRVKFENILDFHNNSNAIATMGIREYNFQVPFGVVNIDGSEITDISEKPNHKFFVNAGFYVLSPEAISRIPKDEFYDMPTLFDDLRDEDKKTVAFPVREYWIDIGRKEELDKANEEYNSIFIKKV